MSHHKKKWGQIDWNGLLQHYEANGRQRNKAEIRWFAIQPSLETAIRIAAAAQDENGKRYGHQNRIWPAPLKKAEPVLLAAKDNFRVCKTFEELQNAIIKALHGISGLAELYYYDTAFRLGSFLGLFANKVHLHRGTRIGAKNLGLNFQAPHLEISDLPPPIQHLLPHEAEDFLCIYADQIIPQTGCATENLLPQHSC